MNIKENDLMEYACEKFEAEKYDEALEAFVLLYSKGYEQDWVLENIYQCYVNGNEAEFQKAYEQCIKDIPVAYDDCLLDFVPYREGEYYIFDKEEQKFMGCFSIHELEKTKPAELLEKTEFDAVALASGWDWRKLFHILVKMKRRKLYAVCQDMLRCASFFKVPELTGYMSNVWLFSNFEDMQDYFHNHTAEYLPGAWFGDPDARDRFSKIVQQEHQYRLTPAGRSTENVLLTIAIPSYHRGNLLLKRMQNLLEFPYDAEIEFVVSKNGTGVYQSEYDEVGKIKDARLNYYDHGRDLKYTINWHYAVEMAHGKYVMLVSDEDDVIPGALDHYLALLRDYPDVNVIRAKSAFQGCMITKREYGEAGIGAFSTAFLRMNYFSGIIVRREDFLAADLLKYEQYTGNSFYDNYPHEWWCAALSRKGAYLQEPVTLISEQDDVNSQEQGYQGEKKYYVPKYATYEARLQQLKGQIEFLNIFAQNDPDYLELGMALVMGKIDFLFGIARYRKYDLEHYGSRIREYGEICMNTIEKLPLGPEKKKKLLVYLQNCCIDLCNEHIDLLEQEASEQ